MLGSGAGSCTCHQDPFDRMKKKISRGIKEVRARVARGQDYEVRYEAKRLKGKLAKLGVRAETGKYDLAGASRSLKRMRVFYLKASDLTVGSPEMGRPAIESIAGKRSALARAIRDDLRKQSEHARRKS
jgi:hypothetical protein